MVMEKEKEPPALVTLLAYISGYDDGLIALIDILYKNKTISKSDKDFIYSKIKHERNSMIERYQRDKKNNEV
jgi:hypothetical protein